MTAFAQVFEYSSDDFMNVAQDEVAIIIETVLEALLERGCAPFELYFRHPKNAHTIPLPGARVLSGAGFYVHNNLLVLTYKDNKFELQRYVYDERRAYHPAHLSTAYQPTDDYTYFELNDPELIEKLSSFMHEVGAIYAVSR